MDGPKYLIGRTRLNGTVSYYTGRFIGDGIQTSRDNMFVWNDDPGEARLYHNMEDAYREFQVHYLFDHWSMAIPNFTTCSIFEQ